LAEIEKVEALVSNGGQLQTAQQFAKAIDLYGDRFLRSNCYFSAALSSLAGLADWAD
jgi:hypothetical protein